MLRATFAMLLATGMIGSFVAVESLAVFADQEINDANTFDTGSVAIDDAPDSAFLTLANMAPGDVVLAPLTLTNNGSLELRYAMSTAATDADGKGLRDQLELTVREKTASPCAAEDGLVLYGPGPLSGGAVGSSAQGADPGDRVLAAAASEDLCFKVELPLATGNAYQDATTTATFTFDAEQTANNP